MNDVLYGFDISSQNKPINQDILVIYTPNTDVVSYNYVLYKDGEILDTYSDTNNKTSIIMSETGEYKIVVKETDINGNINTLESGIYNIDKEKPVISVSNSFISMQTGDKLDLYSDLKIIDNVDGDISTKVTTNYNQLDFDKPGTKKLIYTVSDEAGNIATKTVNINVASKLSDSLIFIQIGLVIILLLFTYLILSFRKSVKLERRISKFSIRPLEDRSLSIFDNFIKTYKNILSKISNGINKSVFIQKYSKKFNKYLPISKGLYNNGIDFISSKIVIAFVFFLVAIFSKALKSEVINSYEMIIPFIAGFFVLDIIYFSKYKIYRKKLENDLLQAIIIMNNAFKSGRSITQAIDLVTTELDGPIAREFEKMSMELSFGLSIDVVFSRFSERVKLEEVTYLTASLSILNKTGGNIIKVFSSIEKSMFNKRKLRIEMNALTGASRLIVYVLFLVPLFFVIMISLINPGYFSPFFTNPIGIILLIFMIIYYIIYIVLVSKIMKVRM